MVYGRGLEQYQAHTERSVSVSCCHLILLGLFMIPYQIVQSISYSYSPIFFTLPSTNSEINPFPSLGTW